MRYQKTSIASAVFLLQLRGSYELDYIVVMRSSFYLQQ